MPELHYNFKYKFGTGISKSQDTIFKYYSLISERKYDKFTIVSSVKKPEQLIGFEYNVGFRKTSINERIFSKVDDKLRYKASVKGIPSFIKHLDMEFLAIPLMIELFDIVFTVNPPEINMFDILLGGYIYADDTFDYETSRAGMSGNTGMVTSQSSPEIKISFTSYNFKSAKKSPKVLTWGREAKPVYLPKNIRTLHINKYILVMNYNPPSMEIFGKQNVKRIYVNEKYFNQFLNEISESAKNNMKILFKNNAITDSLNNIVSDDIDKHFMYEVRQILEMDIIKKRFDIENAKWIIIYYNESLNKDDYEVYWIE